ncbi:hypothetical protein [Parabacteroides gordonii]|uniref:hypothetical protein n=1 Tax=Parabacteroides gordonii TaxID=574930 RepID=UPI0026EF5A05|nr:hypothetical protein [Parabacteroides gordonii]
MKLINTLSILIFLFIAVACSSESDSVMNDLDNKNEVPTSSEAVAAFNISLTGQSIQTRGEDDTKPTDNEGKVSNCFIAAVSNEGTNQGNVLCSFTSETLKDNRDIKMLVKVSDSYKPALKFIAVVNCKIEFDELLKCKTLSDIESVTLVEDVNNKDDKELVKVGTYEVQATDYEITEEGVTKIKNIEIPVFQRAAAIELSSLKVDGEDVFVRSLTLSNIKGSTLVMGEKITDIAYLSKTINDIYKPSSAPLTTDRLYAYENTGEQKTTLKIVYSKYEDNGKAGSVEYERSYTIKTSGHEEVIAGKLYKLNVTISSAGGDNVKFTVADWKFNSVDLGDVQGSTN